MNGLLLDTHVIIWFAKGNRKRLSSKSVKKITREAASGKVWISAISIWELGMLVAKKRLVFTKSVSEWLDEFVEISGFKVLDLDAQTALESNFLPDSPTADPADRIIIAASRRSNLELLTEDKLILDYGKKGNMKCSRVSS